MKLGIIVRLKEKMEEYGVRFTRFQVIDIEA